MHKIEMGPKRKQASPAGKGAGGSPSKKSKDLPPCAGYLISCDVPTKQYIQYLNELKPEDVARTEIPLSEVLPAPAGGIDTGKSPPEPPLGIGHYRRFNWAPEIKAIAIIPDFVVPTANARDVLPTSYTRADVVRPLTLHTLLGRQLLIVWYRCLTSNVLHCFQLHWEVPHRTPI